jgi:hypothetical protein
VDDARPSTLGSAPSADQRAVSAEFGVNALGPSEELRTAEAVMLKNMQAMQDGSTP